jgi:hypothetical protein
VVSTVSTEWSDGDFEAKWRASGDDANALVEYDDDDQPDTVLDVLAGARGAATQLTAVVLPEIRNVIRGIELAVAHDDYQAATTIIEQLAGQLQTLHRFTNTVDQKLVSARARELYVKEHHG